MEVAPTRAVGDAEELLRWLRGDQALPGTDSRVYYPVALERRPAPDTAQTMAEFAPSVLQERAKGLVAQLHAETDRLAERAHQQTTHLEGSREDLMGLLRTAGHIDARSDRET